MRTYTCYLIEAFLGFDSIPKEKLDSLLMQYNFWEKIASYAYIVGKRETFLANLSLWINCPLDRLKLHLEFFIIRYTDEVKFLLWKKIVSAKALEE